MKIAIVGKGEQGDSMICWSQGIFTSYSDSKNGGGFFVILSPEDYMWKDDYDVVVFLVSANEYDACAEMAKEILILNSKGQKLEVFAMADYGIDRAKHNIKALKELCPTIHYVEMEFAYRCWDFYEDSIFVPLAEKLDGYIAAQKRLHCMISGVAEELACKLEHLRVE